MRSFKQNFIHCTLEIEHLCYPAGTCILFHAFGKHVVHTVKQHYIDDLDTAHLKVLGPIYQITMVKGLQGKETVG